MGIYDRYLAGRIRLSDADLPSCVAVIITERDLLEPGAYETLSSLFRWAFEFGADSVVVYVSVLDSEAVPTLRAALSSLDTPREIAVRGPDDETTTEAPIAVSIGLGGKAEFATAVRGIATAAAEGDIDPDALDTADIERRLVFPTAPDLVIKTGQERLSDFLIWQSVYSELYFTDVNWRNFRYRDYLRAIREYQSRSRRFGR
ncbi:MAG: undecaprenyl diphosphate synthase family protein [Natronomonas sp.]